MNPPTSETGIPSPSEPALRVRSLFAYLIGRREAILEIASTPGALGVGALLVLSAGLARNYDKPELWDQPQRLLGPFAASLGISLVLFLVVYGLARAQGLRHSPWRAYRSFLALYWTTAPLAWLYGIPFERMLAPLDATRANL